MEEPPPPAAEPGKLTESLNSPFHDRAHEYSSTTAIFVGLTHNADAQEIHSVWGEGAKKNSITLTELRKEYKHPSNEMIQITLNTLLMKWLEMIQPRVGQCLILNPQFVFMHEAFQDTSI